MIQEYNDSIHITIIVIVVIIVVMNIICITIIMNDIYLLLLLIMMVIILITTRPSRLPWGPPARSCALSYASRWIDVLCLSQSCVQSL